MSATLKLIFYNVSDALNGNFRTKKSDDYIQIWRDVFEDSNSEKENLKNDFNNILKDTKKAKKELETELENG